MLGVLMFVLNIVIATKPVRHGFIPKYLETWAQVSGMVLRLCGENARVSGSAVTSDRFSVDIKRG